ncbi:MAG: glycoside hydrolase family 9 protein [Prevotellaceae bacterium]|jgi:hypothetical protein|nr:glycoside hydrolase family 9 protein [Prevotellaceae bacterium]
MKHISKLFLLLFLLTGWGYVHAQGVSPSFSGDDYKKALWMTTRFYGAQRSGHGPNWLLAEHEPTNVPNALQQYAKNFVKGKSFIKDADGSYDLTGGWFDCGDHVKFGQTLFYSAYMLILGYSEFTAGYDDHYSFNYEGYIGAGDYTWEGKKGKPNGIPDILDEVKYATDYFQKAMRDKSTFYYQVGDGDVDHKHWVTASFMSVLPVSEGGEAEGSRRIYKASGNVTSMASFCGATLAAMARLYKPFDPAYAQACLDKALVAYEFVNGTTKGNTGGGGYYGAKGKYAPDMVIFFAELYRTTKDIQYLTAAENAAGFITDPAGWNHNFSLCYNNTEDLAFYLMVATSSKFATTAKERLKYYVEDLYKPASGYFLNKKNDGWGVLRFPANQAFVYALYDKLNGNEKEINPYTLTSIEYIMGKNGANFSYIVGFGQKHPKYPHHRNFFGEDNDSEGTVQPKAKYLQLGYLTGGSLNNGEYLDEISKYTYSEGGIDYNAGLVGALGYINSIVNPVNTNQFGHPTPDLGDDVSICGMSSVILDSKIPSDGKKTFTWKLNGTQLVSNTAASTYPATEAGEYTCEIDSAGEWNTSGSVNVLGVLPDVNLGDELSLCNPASVTLDPGVTGNGITYRWYIDGELETDATGTTYEVYKAGTYKCEISATGCGSKSAEVTITSRLPVIADAISDSNGNVTLTVNGTGSYEWYTSAEGGAPVHTGSSYSAKITRNTTFYVQDAGSASFKTGPAAAAFTGEGTNWGKIDVNFTAKKAFLITGITVRPYDAQPQNNPTISYQFTLKKDGVNVGTYSTEAVENKGNVNYVLTFTEPVPVSGEGSYTLAVASGLDLVYYLNGPDYGTFSSGDIIEFTSTSNMGGNQSPFPAMFDWQIQSGSGCARALAKAIYDPDGGRVGVDIQPGGICDLYPNPVKDMLYLNLNCNSWNANREVRIEILSTLGSPVKNITTNVEGAAAGINLSGLNQGIYLVRIISGNSVSVKQIIKK